MYVIVLVTVPRKAIQFIATKLSSLHYELDATTLKYNFHGVNSDTMNTGS